MFLPKLQEIKRSRSYQIEFRGLNHNYFVGENEFYDMENMTSTYYPVLSPRSKRKLYTGPYGEITGMASANGRLAFTAGDGFYYNGMKYGTVTEGEKQFVTMGAYIAVFPDKKLFSTVNLTFEDMGAAFVTTDDVHYSLCTRDGEDIGAVSGALPPENPVNKAYWIDTSDTPHTLRQYAASEEKWVAVPTVYTKISSQGIGTRFSEYDGISITGSAIEGFDGDYVLQKVTDNSVVVIFLLEQVFTQEESLSLERKVPDMDYVCELNNRIWGCSSKNHEIYACKLGDPKNWYSYAGISTDSYALTVGSDGDFTGCVSHMGYVLFFKEDIIHKIYGTKPANFQLTDVHARGVEKGSSGSLCVVNETLYYKSRNGICSYDGALPMDVSQQLGTGAYKNANGGALGDKYYVSMEDEEEFAHLFVYDESKGFWHREDSTRAKHMVSCDGALYYTENGLLRGIDGGNVAGMEAEDEEEIRWSAETGEILYAYGDRRYLSRLQLRAQPEEGAELEVFLQYDHKEWRPVYSLKSAVRKTYLIPIKPRRCDTVRLKICGKGNCKVFAVGKTVEFGSDR